MFKKLSIRNYLLIDQLDLKFDPGLTIVTGETGAGKSILLGALGLILGDRAESGVQADESQKTVIEGEFAIGEYALEEFFREHDLDYHDLLILRREIQPQSRSRAFINDSPAALSVVKDLGRRLIDIHQQFDQLDVLEERFQLDMLDALAGQRDMVCTYARDYRAWREAMDRLAQLREQEQASLQEKDFVQFQVDELSEAQIQPNEHEQLEIEAKSLRHATEIRQILSEGHRMIREQEGSPLDQLDLLIRSLQSLRLLHPRVEELAQRTDSLRIELEDLAVEMESVSEDMEGDPGRLMEVEERLNVLSKLLFKHHVQDTGALLDRLAELEARLASLNHRDEEIEQLQARVLAVEKKLRQTASMITQGRQNAAAPLAGQIMERLANLGMGSIRLEWRVEAGEELLATGMDKIQFLMAQQEGAKMTPVKQAASGGEMSRLTLVIKSLVAAAIPLPTLVFDEIDAGVSGTVSMRMGDLLTRMAGHHQLIVITHSPQIAARANCHFHVTKAPENGEVRTRVNTLTGEDRIAAIAIMLSTDPPSKAALANARELILAE